MNQLKYIKIIGASVSVFVGLIFIYSAYTKLFPIELFEFTFVDIGIANWDMAPIEARLFIGLEFFLGSLLLLNINPSKRTYQAVIVLLSVFIIYLLVQIFLYGNKGNCGCFGNTIVMTPLEGIIKNFLLLGMVFFLYFFYDGVKLNYQKYYIAFLFITALSVPFILNPVMAGNTHFDKDETGYKLDLKLLYSGENVKPDVELRKGKWVLAFLSLKCSHCKISASKLQVIKKNNPGIPVYFILNGKEKDLKSFQEETRTENIPYVIFKGMDFLKMSGPELPAIFLIENSIVYAKPNYFVLNQEEIENWLKKK